MSANSSNLIVSSMAVDDVVLPDLDDEAQAEISSAPLKAVEKCFLFGEKVSKRPVKIHVHGAIIVASVHTLTDDDFQRAMALGMPRADCVKWLVSWARKFPAPVEVLPEHYRKGTGTALQLTDPGKKRVCRTTNFGDGSSPLVSLDPYIDPMLLVLSAAQMDDLKAGKMYTSRRTCSEAGLQKHISGPDVAPAAPSDSAPAASSASSGSAPAASVVSAPTPSAPSASSASAAVAAPMEEALSDSDDDREGTGLTNCF